MRASTVSHAFSGSVLVAAALAASPGNAQTAAAPLPTTTEAVPGEGANQTGPQPRPAAGADSGEIVVTAQKRAERLVDVPASLAVLSSAQLKSTSAQRLSDIANYVPNVRITGGDALSSAVYIRGIGSSSRNIGFDSRVGVYIDGVYLGQSPAVDQELLSLDRIEVLRGPQGALFGKNTVAGAINLVTTRPTDTFEASGLVRTGNLGLFQIQGKVSGALASGIDAAASVGYVKRRGYTDNIANGDTMGGRNALSYRGQLKIDKIDNLEIYATVDGLRGREVPYLGNPITDTFATQLDPAAPGDYRVAMNRTSPDKRDLFGASLELAYTLPNDALIKSISAYRYTHFHTLRDVDGSPLDIEYVDYDDRYRQYTEELQYISPKGRRLEYVVGLYYFHQNATTARDANAGALGAAYLGVQENASTTTDGAVKTDNYALYANATYRIVDRLKLGAGFRLSRETKTVDYSIDSSQAPSFNLANGTYDDRLVNKDFSPTVTLTYELNADSNIYLRYSTGYKSGGFNLDFVSADIFPNNLNFGKETVQNYEAGVKLALFDRRLRLNADVFRSDYDNYQLSRYVDLGGGRTAITLTNAGKVRSQGIELEGTLRAFSGLSLRGGIGILDTKFTDYPDADAIGTNYAGQRVPYAPKFTATAGFDYQHAISESLLGRTSLTYSYQGGRYSDVPNTTTATVAGTAIPFNYAKGYGLLDARIGIGPSGSAWEVAVWGRNLTNRKYILNYGREFLGTLFEYRGETRTYGLELSARF